MTTNTNKNTQEAYYQEEEEDRGLIANLYLLVTKSVNSVVTGLDVIENATQIANNKVKNTKKIQGIQDMGKMSKEVQKLQKRYGDLNKLKQNHVNVMELLDLD